MNTYENFPQHKFSSKFHPRINKMNSKKNGQKSVSLFNSQSDFKITFYTLSLIWFLFINNENNLKEQYT